MTMMYRVFYSILGIGILFGCGFGVWSLVYVSDYLGFGTYLALSACLGLSFGFMNYVIIKWVMRLFVSKFHTLERLLVGTNPPQLRSLMQSNEIDEIEQSMVRISDRFRELSSSKRKSSSSGRLMVNSRRASQSFSPIAPKISN